MIDYTGTYRNLAKICGEQIETAMNSAKVKEISFDDEVMIGVVDDNDRVYHSMVIKRIFFNMDNDIVLDGVHSYGAITEPTVMYLSFFIDNGANLSALCKQVCKKTDIAIKWAVFISQDRGKQISWIESHLHTEIFNPSDISEWEEYEEVVGLQIILKSFSKGSISLCHPYAVYNTSDAIFVGFETWDDVLDYFFDRIVERLLNQR